MVIVVWPRTGLGFGSLAQSADGSDYTGRTRIWDGQVKMESRLSC